MLSATSLLRDRFKPFPNLLPNLHTPTELEQDSRQEETRGLFLSDLKWRRRERKVIRELESRNS
jgi:hypothetical protein